MGNSAQLQVYVSLTISLPWLEMSEINTSKQKLCFFKNHVSIKFINNFLTVNSDT